jgi:hypothetical protein
MTGPDDSPEPLAVGVGSSVARPTLQIAIGRGAALDISQLRSGSWRVEHIHASWRDAGFPPSRKDGFSFKTSRRHSPK